MDSGVWYPALTRRDYTIAANLTAVGLDDPTRSSTRTTSGSTRNYSEYCNPEVDDLIDRQSREIDPKKRLALVIQIQQRLEADVAKPILGWRFGYFVQWPYVKNLVPHHVIYNYARMQEVWLDK
jgi:peptide/nickel transport system substrate-binding protein